MKKIFYTFVKVVLAIAVISCFALEFPSFADVGGIQRYQSSGSSSSSSKSSSSSSSSSYSSGSSSSSRRSSSSTSSSSYSSESSIGGAILAFIVLFVIFMWHKSSKKHLAEVLSKLPNNLTPDNTKSVANSIREIDPAFSENDFLAWTKEVFIKLQTAWTNKDWAIIRPFESNELFEQHNSQLQDFINTGKTNIVERINVSSATLYSFVQDGDKETLKVTLKAVMRDYIIDDATKKVLEGNPNIDQYMTYRLTFIRKAGIKTVIGTDKKSTTNCPNCGAPTKITSSGECEYCGSIITTGEHGWVLANLEGI